MVFIPTVIIAKDASFMTHFRSLVENILGPSVAYRPQSPGMKQIVSIVEK